MRALNLGTDPTGGDWTAVRDLLWVSAGPPRQGWWQALRAQHDRTGCWPLLLGSISDRDPDRPWADGEDLDPALIRTRPGDHDVGALLAGWWGTEGGPWPGLAHPGEPGADPDEHAAAMADELLSAGWLTHPRLGLVPSGRGADSLADAAWTGPLNHENDTAKLAAVVRSWEDRFGARVIGVGFDTLHLSIAAPPTTSAHAHAIAAEHEAFCPDNIWQGPGSLDTYAKTLVDAPMWSFWWD